MDQVNVLTIQETLRGVDKISVPWVQKKYQLGYLEARQFVAQLIMRGWVKKEPVGMYYEVIKENLCLRKIRRKEVNDLIEHITQDCVTALNCIQKNNATGASFRELSSAIRGDDDTRDAIDILENHELIFCVNDCYFLRVSKMTIEILSNVVKMRRSRDLKRAVGKGDDTNEIVKLFDPLFS